MSNFDEELRRLERQNQEKAQLFLRKLTAKIPLFAGILIALWWVFYGMVEVEFRFDLMVENILLTIATIVFALTYCNLIAEGGFRLAEGTEDYVAAKKEYLLIEKKSFKYQEEILDYAKEIAKRNLVEVRKRNLEGNFLKYEDYFDENGELIHKDFRKDKSLTRHQIRIIRKCARLHIILPNIFEIGSETYFGLKSEQSKKSYVSGQQVTKVLTRTILSFTSLLVFFHYKGFNLDGVIYAFFQIALWTASGVMQRSQNYNFVLDALLPQLVTKTSIIKGYLDKNNINIEGEENG